MRYYIMADIIMADNVGGEVNKAFLVHLLLPLPKNFAKNTGKEAIAQTIQ